jgi:succinate dehydrogenase / fumarate reductase iron-sulfur subunit
MVELTLPRGSQVKSGKDWGKPDGAKRTRKFKIYRYDPETGENPRWDTYHVDLDQCGPMLLDALIYIKNHIDPTLTFRRSCREGVCGSCAMNIDGNNTLACTKGMDEVKGGVIRISPLPHMPVVKDLVPDLTQFYAQYASRSSLGCTPKRRRLRKSAPANAGRPRKAGRRLRVHPVRLLHDIVPVLLVERRSKYLGPAALLHAHRWVVDSRDEATGERLDALEDPFRLYRCHTIMNRCAQVCPMRWLSQPRRQDRLTAAVHRHGPLCVGLKHMMVEGCGGEAAGGALRSAGP